MKSQKILDFYANSYPNSAFSFLNQIVNCTTQIRRYWWIEPWITWPTVHRGVSNIDHEISDLGQDLTKVNKEFPNVYDFLAKEGFKVGIFGSFKLSIPKDLENYKLYRSFAAGDEYSAELSYFQNLIYQW